MSNKEIINKIPRKYYAEDINITEWEKVEPLYNELLEMEVNSAEDLVSMMEKYSELEFILMNEMAWRYVHMTCYADDKEKEEAFNDFYGNIVSPAMNYDFKLKKKYYESPYKNELSEERYSHLNKIISKDIEMFREENIPLMTEERKLANNYGSILGGMTADYKGEEKTMTQLAVFMKNPDRSVREETWKLRFGKLLENSKKLDDLFNELMKIRNKIAANTGFDNYRDYEHKNKGRFSYTPEDVMEFHKSVEEYVVPFMKEKNEERKQKLGVDKLEPWDTSVDLDGKVLKPFKDTDELIALSQNVLGKVKPEFGKQLELMNNTGLLDLANRKGKAPGGYNYPLPELGSSFIFMNSVGLQSDVSTLLHEMGHALHAKAVTDEPLAIYSEPPSEVAELASMSMELLSMDYWDEYYDNVEDLKKAKREQLEGTLMFLPWCMVVDAFQQWIYTSGQHTNKERAEYFSNLMDRFGLGDYWANYPEEKKNRWMFQLHIFEVPFYYIEYGIAQLGALSIYKNYKENPEKAVKDYEKFLKLGYSKSMKEIYETGGIDFSFSADHIKKIVAFVKEELQNL